jgi:secreted trypsin-like serine protease
MKKINLYFISVLVLSLANSACNKSEDSSRKEPPQKEWVKDCSAGEMDDFGIINGKTVKQGSWIEKSTVLLAIKASDQADSLCTAVIIGKDLLLTAAHCVKHDFNKMTLDESKKNGVVVLSANLYCEADESVTKSLRAIDKVLIHPKYDENNKTPYNRYDLAVVKIHGTFPVNYQKVELVNSEFFEKINRKNIKIMSAGFGKTNGYRVEENTTPRLRAFQYFTDVSLDKFEDIEISQKTGGICAGDSGGPLFVRYKRKNYLLGISSAVTSSYTEESCLKEGYFMNVFKHRDFINQAKKELTF